MQSLLVSETANQPNIFQTSEQIRVLHVHAGNMYGGVEAMMLTQVRERNPVPVYKTLSRSVSRVGLARS